MQRSTERILTHPYGEPAPASGPDNHTGSTGRRHRTRPADRNSKRHFCAGTQEHAPWSTPAPPADRFGYDLSSQPREEGGEAI